MSRQYYKFLQSVICIGLVAALVEKWETGKLSFFINMRFSFLTAIGILLLLIMAIIGFHSIFSPSHLHEGDGSTTPGSTVSWIILFMLPVFSALAGLSVPVILTIFFLVLFAGLARLAAHHNQLHEHPGQSLSASITTLVILTIPVVAVTFVPIKPLSSATLSSRGMSLSAPASVSGGSTTTLQVTPIERSILDWVKIFNYEADRSPYHHESADVTGFVYHKEHLGTNQFMVSRFIITCCVADAFAIGMVVDWPDAAALPEDTWVQVKGTIDEITINDQAVPLIHAVSVTPVEVPEQPYLYP